MHYRVRFIELAGEINAEMPHYVASKVAEGLNEFERSVKGAAILILGVAYKADIDDPRESPALDIIGLLRQHGAHVSYSNPHVPMHDLRGTTLDSEPLTAERLTAADCVVIVTNHRAFDYGLIARHARLIIDTRNALKSASTTGAVVVHL